MNQADFQIRARFRHAVKTAGLADGSTLLVAVSGGADSRALLELCRDEAAGRSWRLRVAHVDHALPGGFGAGMGASTIRDESAERAAWVREIARASGCPSLGARVAPRFWERAAGRSIEDAARQIRRRALRRMARRAGASAILLGHTKDDQAETLLLQLLRGSGIRGMSGMAVRTGRFVRPLLAIRREELRDFLIRRDLDWRDDPLNENPRFLRARIRRDLIPLLERDFQPGTVTVLARTAGVFRSAREFLRAAEARAWEDLSPESGPGWIRLDRPRLASYHRAVIEEILRRAYHVLHGSPRDLRNAHVRSLADAVSEPRPRHFDLPAGIRVRVDRSWVRLDRVGPLAVEEADR